MLFQYLKLLRIHQWIKNVIIFAGIIFAKKLTDPESVQRVVAAFFLFSLVASCQYVVNDYLDRKEDALHPEKKHRPLASGKLDPSFALFITAIILPLSLILAYLLHPVFFGLVAFYLVFNVLYSKFLKHMVILDVMSISIGFVIRAIAGSVIIHVSFSSWLLLCTFMLALFWGFSKRRGELIILEGNAKGHRKILDEYSTGFLDMMLGIVATMTLMSYVLYVTSPTTIANLGTDQMIYTIPIVVYAIFRSLYIIYIKNMGHNPTKAILSDWGVLLAGLIWVALVIAIMYSGFGKGIRFDL
ncbi:decaprenyl-phosphate phosphoribosyltransferase [Leptospira yasudae]|uniref:Decaprenyl-phosphate phosphoribosyltransferase n=1 Tax=Leptospira yasudae TaxID=2202201 RepID=A0A5F2ANY5_9LEPT|nr:decaprenyl-phosphate phosphoribosyltransferase [Leptospira yasudae]MBW0433543.1 decaprenyl-phosphate phosphoribosyltransferase [Leptospira yasudae]RHX81998.1 decaprenyl-phosphate phosphoribosyltransferase [Leptospira yasudae]RHX95206.1 decaprenyl-phosphate phosphoribosyltransferase [Leptospira yasudae]TGK30629.1 decaprenyl-phosphate phosphoribosyltransferase [Leptospira yasudae]TGL76686.1 decaprenyl-phosphate phosphoribosyltransferase [Leptospira yasudae]